MAWREPFKGLFTMRENVDDPALVDRGEAGPHGVDPTAGSSVSYTCTTRCPLNHRSQQRCA